MPRRQDIPDDAQARSGGAVSTRIVRLKKRADFVRTAKGARAAMPGLVLQCRPAPETAEQGAVRVGFTATKKLGGAVVRNRIKRRLRAAAAQVMPQSARSGYDYVLIGRSGTAARPFALLAEDLRIALKRVHRPGGRDGKAGQGPEGHGTQRTSSKRNSGSPKGREGRSGR